MRARRVCPQRTVLHTRYPCVSCVPSCHGGRYPRVCAPVCSEQATTPTEDGCVQNCVHVHVHVMRTTPVPGQACTCTRVELADLTPRIHAMSSACGRRVYQQASGLRQTPAACVAQTRPMYVHMRIWVHM